MRLRYRREFQLSVHPRDGFQKKRAENRRLQSLPVPIKHRLHLAKSRRLQHRERVVLSE